jgi:hypothetical protein
MKSLKEYITILYTYWDTPQDFFENSLKKSVEHNVNIIIVNDQSSDKYYQSLLQTVKKMSKLNKDITITIVNAPFKLGQAGATYYGTLFIYTPYTIRVDSDDILEYIPDLEIFSEDFDIATSFKKTPISFEHFCNNFRPNLNGNIIRTEILRFLYADWQFMLKYNNIFPEDIVTTLRRLLLLSNLKIEFFGPYNFFRIKRENSETSRKINYNKHHRKYQLLTLLLERYDFSETDYNYYLQEFIRKDKILRKVLNRGKWI